MKPVRILIVEDERIIGMTLRQMLEERGYAVAGVVASGAAALEQTTASRPDLVLMDIHLEGGMDGITAAGKIHERDGTPVVFLTAYAEDAMLRRSRLSLPYGYLVKPIDARELHATIQMALAQHTAQLALERSEQRFRTLVAAAPIGIFQTDAAGGYVYVNSCWLQLTGMDLHTAQGEGWLATVHAEDRERVRALWQEQLSAQTDFNLEYRLRAPELTWVASRVTVLRDGQGAVEGYLGTLSDITARKRRQAELLSARDRLRGLVERLETDREAERARVAEELYEGIAQQVSGIQMQVSAALSRLNNESAASVGALADLNELFSETLGAIGSLASALRPAMLNVLGLEAAVRLLLHDFEKRTGISSVTNFGLHEEIEELNPRVRTTLYRVVEDFLTNATSYPNVAGLALSIQRTLSDVELRVQYRGVRTLAKRGSSDLIILAIEERVSALGGSFEGYCDPQVDLSLVVVVPADNKLKHALVKTV